MTAPSSDRPAGPMPPVLSIVGRSGSGKTTLLERLVPWLGARGWRVGVFKHDSHGFQIDRPGKDTARLFDAGAERVVIAGPTELALRVHLHGPVDPTDVAREYFGGLDFLLTEGYKTGPWPRVEVARRALVEKPTRLGDPELRALVTDLPGPFPVPVFGLDEVERFGRWVESTWLSGRRPAGPVPPSP